METTYITIGYAVYLPIALILTYYVARNLFKNSKVFMLDIFSGKEEIALSTNRLFEIGFYLINLGFAFMILKIESSNLVDNSQILIELLSTKIGGFSIYLGAMLFANLYLFFRGRKISKKTVRSR
ncbi:MAG: hypothetical protein H6600_03250 [Flavobacteriales bacterium]|nr:hypothetical protein [Flavobacteriales bacterium]MCB9197448.1 hypothetical protein [Flavobacteriales bacterium]